MNQRLLLSFAGCAMILTSCAPLQQATKIGDNRYDIQVTGCSLNPLEVTSALTKAFHEKARTECNGEYRVVSQQLVRGKGHSSDVMIGSVECD
jgi:hypothetical protein